MEKNIKNNNTVSEESQDMPSSLKDKFNKSEEFDLFSNQQAEIPDCQNNAKLSEFPMFQSIYQPMNFFSKLNYSSFTEKQSGNQRKMNLVDKLDYSNQDCFKSKSFQRFHTKQNQETIKNCQQTFLIKKNNNKKIKENKNKQLKKDKKKNDKENKYSIQSLIFKKSQDISTQANPLRKFNYKHQQINMVSQQIKQKQKNKETEKIHQQKDQQQNFNYASINTYTNNFKANFHKQITSKVSINKQVKQNNLNSQNYFSSLN